MPLHPVSFEQYQAQLERARAAEQLVSGQHFTEAETLAEQINNQTNPPGSVGSGRALAYSVLHTTVPAITAAAAGEAAQLPEQRQHRDVPLQ